MASYRAIDKVDGNYQGVCILNILMTNESETFVDSGSKGNVGKFTVCGACHDPDLQ